MAGLMRTRHNKILDGLVREVGEERGDRYVEQARTPANPRPDLVVMGTDKVTIFDVTVPFETSREAFDKARSEKNTKIPPFYCRDTGVVRPQKRRGIEEIHQTDEDLMR